MEIQGTMVRNSMVLSVVGSSELTGAENISEEREALPFSQGFESSPYGGRQDKEGRINESRG